MQSYQFDCVQYRKKLNKKKTFPLIFIILAIVLLIISLVILTPIKSNYYEFYFVAIKQCESYTEANNYSSTLIKDGGAGYVYYDKKYVILATHYNSKNDAENVVNNLHIEYPNSEVYTISAKKYTKQSHLTTSQNDAISQIVSFLDDAILTITNYSIQYDKNEIKYNELSIRLKNFHNEFKKLYDTFITYFKTNSKYNTTKSTLNSILTSFSTLSSSEEDSIQHEIKYQTIKIVVDYCSFLSDF